MGEIVILNGKCAISTFTSTQSLFLKDIQVKSLDVVSPVEVCGCSTSASSYSLSNPMPIEITLKLTASPQKSLALSTDHPLNEKEMLARLFTTDELLNILNVKLNKGRKK